jgi:hypothetical protein
MNLKEFNELDSIATTFVVNGEIYVFKRGLSLNQYWVVVGGQVVESNLSEFLEMKRLGQRTDC